MQFSARYKQKGKNGWTIHILPYLFIMHSRIRERGYCYTIIRHGRPCHQLIFYYKSNFVVLALLSSAWPLFLLLRPVSVRPFSLGPVHDI